MITRTIHVTYEELVDGYNAHGEQYRLIIFGASVATFTDIDRACDVFSTMACEHCRRCSKRDHDGILDCCRIETWTQEL